MKSESFDIIICLQSFNIAQIVIFAVIEALSANVQLAYAIGVSHPVSVSAFGLDADGHRVDVSEQVRFTYDLTPKGITDYLGLLKLDYSKISGGNHMIHFI